jgi:PST family polysaccharide transporter
VVSVATAPWLGVWALVLGALAGSLSNTILSYALAPHCPRLSFAWGSIRGFVGYGQWVFLTGVAGLAGSLALQMMISRTLGAAALGLYFLASKAASVPVDAVRSIVGAVAFPMFVRLRDDATALGRTFSTLLAGLYLAALPAFALIFVLAPELEHALGAHWAGTAPMMQILSIAGAAALLGQMFVPLLLGLGMPERVLAIEIVQTVVLLVVQMPALQLFEVNGAALSWLAGNVAALALVATWTTELLPGAVKDTRRRVAAAAVTAGGAALGAALGAMSLQGMAAIGAGGLLGVLVAVVTLWWLDRRQGLQLVEYRELLLPRSAPVRLYDAGRQLS